MPKSYSYTKSFIGPSVHLYVNPEKPECLLITTADGSSITNEKFQTAACCSRAELELITMDDMILIRVIEIIFCLKDLLTNPHNYGWIYPTKQLLIIDFSIDNDEIKKCDSTSATRLIYEKLPRQDYLALDKLRQTYNDYRRNQMESAVRRVIEKLPDSFLAAIDTATNSIDGFVDLFPFAFSNRAKEMAHSKLQKYVQRSRDRFNTLLMDLKIKKQ